MRTLLPLALIAFATPALAQDGTTSAPVPGVALTDKVWVRTDRPDMPGSMQLFLSDGTLLTDSCWQTYRLSDWRMVDETHIVWEEDGIEIPARILALDEARLTLELDLVGGPETQTFSAASAPFVCPDMPR